MATVAALWSGAAQTAHALLAFRTSLVLVAAGTQLAVTVSVTVAVTNIAATTTRSTLAYCTDAPQSGEGSGRASSTRPRYAGEAHDSARWSC